jgi:hypothetical protein
MPLLKRGSNSKLGKSVASFNLRAIETCPGRTPYCEALCYADKGFFKFKSVISTNEEALLASKQPDFVDRISAEIKKHKIKTVRIHAAGDFYSPFYLNKWREIAKANPDTNFWAYTRSYRAQKNMIESLHFLFEIVTVNTDLSNFQIFASIDPYIESNNEYPPIPMRKAYLVKDFSNLPADTIACPNQKNKAITCEKCTFCFKQPKPNTMKRNVAFIEH